MRAMVLALALLLLVVPAAAGSHALGFKWGGQAPIDITVRSSLTDAGLQASLVRAMGLWSDSPVIDMRFVTKGKAMVTVEQRYLGEGSLAFAVPSTRGFRLTSVLIVVNEWFLEQDTDYPLSLQHEHIRDGVMCHELGHALGLDHRDDQPGESCIYRVHRWSTPDAHDYEMLLELYE